MSIFIFIQSKSSDRILFYGDEGCRQEWRGTYSKNPMDF